MLYALTNPAIESSRETGETTPTRMTQETVKGTTVIGQETVQDRLAETRITDSEETTIEEAQAMRDRTRGRTTVDSTGQDHPIAEIEIRHL